MVMRQFSIQALGVYAMLKGVQFPPLKWGGGEIGLPCIKGGGGGGGKVSDLQLSHFVVPLLHILNDWSLGRLFAYSTMGTGAGCP